MPIIAWLIILGIGGIWLTTRTTLPIYNINNARTDLQQATQNLLALFVKNDGLTPSNEQNHKIDRFKKSWNLLQTFLPQQPTLTPDLTIIRRLDENRGWDSHTETIFRQITGYTPPAKNRLERTSITSAQTLKNFFEANSGRDTNEQNIQQRNIITAFQNAWNNWWKSLPPMLPRSTFPYERIIRTDGMWDDSTEEVFKHLTNYTPPIKSTVTSGIG